MKIDRHWLGRCAAGLLALFISIGAHALPYSGLVVFGDSLSDTGNNAIVFDTNGAPLPPGTLRTPLPVTPTFIPTFPYESNRYSNGPVWVDNFAAALGLSAAPSLAGGTNFAFGGARTGPAGSVFPFSLRDQTSFFLNATGGVAPPSNLYVLAGGGNDARDAFQIAAGGGNPAGVIAQYANDMAIMIGALLAAGVTDLMVVNVPDIGKTPAIGAFGTAASVLASTLAASMNAALDNVLNTLVFAPGVDVFRLDAFGLINDVFGDPAAFGLTNVTIACASDPACIAAPSGSFFWDGIHPTAAGHALIARAALAAIPEPSSLLLLTLGVLALVRRRSAS